MTDRYCVKRHLDLAALGGTQFDIFYNKGGTKLMANSGFNQRHGRSFRARKFRPRLRVPILCASVFITLWAILAISLGSVAVLTKGRH